MHFKAHFCLLAYLLGLTCAKSLYSDSEIGVHRRRVSETPKRKEKEHVKEEQIEEEPIEEVQKIPRQDIIALAARERAIHVIMEKMLFALGPDFLPWDGIPDNETYPTVASPLNLTTDPCPEIYMKCSSEKFLSSCHPPGETNIELWNQRLNLYFDLPHNLLVSDSLLNATLRVYKNGTLPMHLSNRLVVELYVYKKSLTKAYDINYVYDSRSVSNDYNGWISFDVTDLIQSLNLSEHHGFLVKVKEFDGTYWNDPTLIVPMKCFEDNKTVVPIPFGVITDQPEQKYPSLTITTGVKDQYYYSSMESEHTYDNRDRILDQDFEDHEYDIPYRENHRVIDSDYLSEKINSNSLDNERVNDPMDYDREFNKKYTPLYYDHWLDDDQQMEEKITQKRHHPRRKNKQIRDNSKEKRSNDDPKAHREFMPVNEDSSEIEYNIQPKHSPIEHSHSKKFNLKSLRKPVENQVYNSDISAEHLDIAPPTAKTSLDMLSSWHRSNMKNTEDFLGHHRGSKKRDKNRRRHHNHHRDEHSESHRTHSRSHLRSHVHNEHENRVHEKENMQLDS